MNALNVYVKCGCVFVFFVWDFCAWVWFFLLDFLAFAWNSLPSFSCVLCMLVSTICFATLYYSACKSAAEICPVFAVYHRVCVVCGCHHHHERKTHTHTHTLTVLTHTKAKSKREIITPERGRGNLERKADFEWKKEEREEESVYVCIWYMKMYLSVSCVAVASERDSCSSQKKKKKEGKNGVYVGERVGCWFRWHEVGVESESAERNGKERREGRRTGTFRGEREMMNSLFNCNISLGWEGKDWLGGKNIQVPIVAEEGWEVKRMSRENDSRDWETERLGKREREREREVMSTTRDNDTIANKLHGARDRMEIKSWDESLSLGRHENREERKMMKIHSDREKKGEI